jgi:hypothetical protein
MMDDRKRRRQHQPTEHDSRRFVRIRADDETVDTVTSASREPPPEEELQQFGETSEVDTGTALAPFQERLKASPEQAARLADLEVIWGRLGKVRGEQRARRETERRVDGAASSVLEFQFKVRILWGLAVGGLGLGGGSAFMLIRGMQATAGAEATSEYRLRVTEEQVKDMAPRLRAAEESARMFALRLEELGRAVGGHNSTRTKP